MNKTVTVLALLGLLAPAFPARASVHLNPQVGLNASRLTSDPSDSTERKARFGYQIGGFLRIGDRAYLQPGVFYTALGTKLETKSTSFTNVKDNADIIGIQVPVLVGVDLVSSPVLTLRVNGGGSATMITKVKSNEFGLTKDDYKSTIFGAVVGGGVDIGLLSADLSYEVGLTKMFQNGSDAKNNVLRLAVGLKLPPAKSGGSQ